MNDLRRILVTSVW